MRLNVSIVTELMNRKDMTPEQISYKTGLDAVSVKNILMTGYISADAAERIASCLQVTASDIMMQEPSGSIENSIEFFKGSDRATVTFSQGRYKSRIMKLSHERPDECKILVWNRDGSIVAHCPVSWVRISPPVKMNLTDEQREKKAEVMRQNCQKPDNSFDNLG